MSIHISQCSYWIVCLDIRINLLLRIKIMFSVPWQTLLALRGSIAFLACYDYPSVNQFILNENSAWYLSYWHSYLRSCIIKREVSLGWRSLAKWCFNGLRWSCWLNEWVNVVWGWGRRLRLLHWKTLCVKVSLAGWMSWRSYGTELTQWASAFGNSTILFNRDSWMSWRCNVTKLTQLSLSGTLSYISLCWKLLLAYMQPFHCISFLIDFADRSRTHSWKP